MAEAAREREWEYWPQGDSEPFRDKDGNTVLGWHPRNDEQDELQLLAEFEVYHGSSLTLRPILVRDATEVECRIYGYEEGTFVRCTTRARNSRPMWQIEVAGADSGEGVDG